MKYLVCPATIGYNDEWSYIEDGVDIPKRLCSLDELQSHVLKELEQSNDCEFEDEKPDPQSLVTIYSVSDAGDIKQLDWAIEDGIVSIVGSR